jgi:hypothetical protein
MEVKNSLMRTLSRKTCFENGNAIMLSVSWHEEDLYHYHLVSSQLVSIARVRRPRRDRNPRLLIGSLERRKAFRAVVHALI